MKSVRWMTSLPLSFKGEPADNIFDAWSSTGYRRPLDTDYVDLDLGECCLLSEVSFALIWMWSIRKMKFMNFAYGRMAGRLLRVVKEGSLCVLQMFLKCIVVDQTFFSKGAETCTPFCI